jgi:hypothetical protein
MQITVSEVRFTSASKEERSKGLLGWLAFVINDTIKIDGVTLRRTLDGRPTLSWPARLDGAGRTHHYIWPLTDDARCHLENQVFALLGREITT